ncbi:Cytochrome c4 [Ephemeroptericola cinctiostellae]|uniref:Cytochrome c4 n=1 Tax=Ephemeroptericola cinctiostellae TaxID=2268024 RepID=A0A345DDB9_9BURK|nr:c-type cytochrome [Ephemeroptericola cinctiostellae]AXF86357.1 Cytochrome c4 [Ephemeroptericola cinctiostellae]
MKRSYAYLLAAVGIVAAISGVAIAQQKDAPAVAKAEATTAAPVAATAVAAPVAATFDIKSVQGMPVGVERGQAIAVGICASCHNADGNSTVPLQPKLAGQHEAYLLKQLHDFKAVEGATEAARANMVDGATGQIKVSTMGGQVAALSDDDMKSLSAWFSAQKLTPDVAKQDDPVLSKLGEKIYRGGVVSKSLPACAGCHGPTGAGIMAKYPRVGGQYSDYLVVQLKAFREDARKNSAPMQDIAKRMTDTEIAAVADYMAGLR